MRTSLRPVRGPACQASSLRKNVCYCSLRKKLTMLLFLSKTWSAHTLSSQTQEKLPSHRKNTKNTSKNPRAIATMLPSQFRPPSSWTLTGESVDSNKMCKELALLPICTGRLAPNLAYVMPTPRQTNLVTSTNLLATLLLPLLGPVYIT